MMRTSESYSLLVYWCLVFNISPSVATPTPGSPKTDMAASPQLAPQGPSQILTALLARLPDATNRTLIDQAAVDFAILNSKAARKRLIKVSFFSVSNLDEP